MTYINAVSKENTLDIAYYLGHVLNTHLINTL